MNKTTSERFIPEERSGGFAYGGNYLEKNYLVIYISGERITFGEIHLKIKPQSVNTP